MLQKSTAKLVQPQPAQVKIPHFYIYKFGSLK